MKLKNVPRNARYTPKVNTLTPLNTLVSSEELTLAPVSAN